MAERCPTLTTGNEFSLPSGADLVVDRAGVGDNQLHASESQTLEILHIAAYILNGRAGPDLMGLQNVTSFKAQQTA
ncbi:MAG: hypothetical protein ABSB15_13250 [Bryobacteraceae bacterium]|jgi:hypothetical protein